MKKVGRLLTGVGLALLSGASVADSWGDGGTAMQRVVEHQRHVVAIDHAERVDPQITSHDEFLLSVYEQEAARDQGH